MGDEEQQGNDPGAMLNALVRNYERPAEKEKAIAERSRYYRGFKPGEVSSAVSGAGGGDVLGRMRDLKSGGQVIGDQCVALAKAAVGVTGSVAEWRKGVSAEAGTLKPGTPIATFLDRQGRQSERYAGGGTGTMGAHLDHAGVFESYIKDKAGKLIGMNIAEQFKGSGGVRSKAYYFGKGFGEHNASNYNAIQDKARNHLGGNLNPMNREDGDATSDKGFTSSGWHKADASDLAKQSPAERLAAQAPPRPQAGGGAGRSGTSIPVPIHIHNNGDAEHTAHQVQKHIQRSQDYHVQDMSFENI